MVQPDPAWRSWLGRPNVPEATFVTGTDLEIVRAFFPEGPPPSKPELRLVVGPVCSGKTRYRESQCEGMVSVDPVDVYLGLTDDGNAIPENVGDLVQRVGESLAVLAIKERRSIVVELVPTDAVTKPIDDLLRAAKARRYAVSMAQCEVSDDEGRRRHLARGRTSISALEVQKDTLAWLMKGFFPGLATKR